MVQIIAAVEAAEPLALAPARAFDPFAGPPISHLVPLTESQAEIWAACQLGGDDANRAYNESVGLRLRGPLDRAALEQALQAVVARHEALRLAFSATGEYAYVVEHLRLPVHYQDFSHEPAAAQPGQVAAYIEGEAQFIFDLRLGPLVKAGLLRLGAAEHHLVFTAHHLVCDGWSMGIFLQELGALYSAYCQGLEPALPAAESFSHYADQQLALGRHPAYHQVEQYWLGQFSGEVPALTLPTDFARPALRTYQSARADYALPPELLAKLKQVGLQAGCTFVTTLLVAFEVFLYQLTGQTDLVVGLPAAGQPAAAMPQLVGHCVNLLPLRSQLRPDLGFTDYLRQRRGAILDAYEHQQLTFGSLLKKLPLGREASRVPLVPVVFNLDLGLDDNVAFAALTAELHSNPRAYEVFELFLNASGSERALTLEWSYNTALFRPATIARHMADFTALLHRLTEQPAASLRRLTAPAAAPLASAYQALNTTAQPYPATQTLGQLLAEQAAATPQATALEFGSRQLTYRELDQRANQLAHYLLHQGVRAGEVVALAAERSPDLLVALLACVKCGATYVPLDPTYPRERLVYMLADSRARLLLASEPLAVDPAVPLLLLAEAQQAAAACPTQAPPLLIDSASPLYVLYTSGSTGRPKGVVVTHRNVVNFLLSMRQAPGLTATDRLLAITTISFDIAGLELFLPLLTGATIVLAPTAIARDGRQLLQLLATARITVLQATPSCWRMLLDAGWTQPYPLKALSGGEALPPELAERLLARCQSVWNLYGPTETTIWSSVKQLTPGAAVTIGRPIANTQFYVLDEHQRPVAPGTVGELCIAGDGVALGYLHCPSLTAEKFIANPFAAGPGALLYRTGDLGQLLETGDLQCLGRLDQQVKLRGHRIELGEIEHALLELAEVREAVVVAQQPRPGDERLVAYLVLAADAGADDPLRAAQWREQLLARLPTYMVPSEFHCLPQLPRTLNGKTDRNALARLNSRPAAAPPAASHVPPRTPTEQLISTIWQECLGVSQVGVTDDFFAAGGHSLTAVQVMVRLEQATGQRLPLASLLTHPTIEKLALLLEGSNQPRAWGPLVPIKPSGRKTPLYIVHGAGLNVLIFKKLPPHLDPEQPVYGLQATGLDGVEVPLDTTEAIAAHYVAAITAQNPHGPYALAGYSFGGIIAFEMARQLLAAGRQVKFLGMLDTYAEQARSQQHPLVTAWRVGVFTCKNLLFKGGLFLRNPRLVIRYYNAASARKLVEFIRYSAAERQARHQRLHGHSQQAAKVYAAAQRQYRLTAQPLHIHLFRNAEKTYYMDDFEFLGWREFAQHGVSVSDIPGNHFSLFDAPHAEACARAIQQALDAC